jgi:serine/threonine protein kinase/Tfp pilus assembly protein PilF
MPPISPDRWRILSAYLDEGLELAPDRRAGWLASIGARDATLAADLRAMLAEHEVVHRQRFLDGAVLDPQAVTRQSLVGQVLGSYRLLSLIGQGGTGSVWLAERCDGRFEGHAAIKLLNVSLMGRSGEERFRREGTILARLRHPRIAHLIDAGVSAANQPYLVLEHVDGLRIDQHCDDNAIGVEGRLRLFLDVLEAVAHAHANLIVHRDIKPPNVLVTRTGQVKLLDFGIAKLIESESEVPAVTREGARALTPEFAAPEQLSGGAVTTATDVYALGVLLYILLTGRHPAGRAVESPATLVRAIVDSDPPRPSDVVMSSDESGSLAGHAARCRTTPSRLQRALRGDLDTIVARALKKHASERYASVTALADDLRRHLRREAISARPDTLRYRASTFVRRHARAVAFTAGTLVLLVALTTIYTIQLSVERDRARHEAAKAVKVSNLVMGLLTSADPYANYAGGEPTVRDLLDRGAEQAVTSLGNEPDLLAEMLTMMGRTYRRLGMYEKALPVLQQALSSGQVAFGAEHASVAATLHDVGVLYGDTGDYAAAGRSLERALAMRRRLLGPDHQDIAVTLAELGRLYQDQGFNDRAEPLHREALALRRRVLGESHRETPVSISDVASVLRLRGDLTGAETLLLQCLVLNRAARGEDHPNTIMTAHDLALIAAARGDDRSAERTFRDVIARQRIALGERHPVIAMMLNNLAHVLKQQRRPDEAAAVLDEALGIARTALGNRHQLVAIYLINRAALELERGGPADAEAWLRQALVIRTLAPGVVPSRRRTLIEHEWNLPATRSLLGEALVALGRYDEAETLLLAARGELAALPSPPVPDLNATYRRLVTLYTAWGKPRKAVEYRSLLQS